MNESAIVPAPVVFPGMCLCGAQTTPILDTFMEKPGTGRIYLCKRCSLAVARAWGFAEGEELDKLRDARGELDRAEASMAKQAERAAKYEAEIAELKREKAALVEERDQALNEAEQLKHIARAIDASAKELVGS